ncbi:hypothetical protein M407DRAFT_210881, partial [Tulasnella calospora MUT 4182]
VTGSSTSLLWTSNNPLQSQLFSTLGQLYRFDTVNNSGKMITTLYRSIKQGKEDRIARLEWGTNYSLGRATIGRNMVSMVDLVLPGGAPGYRRFFGPDGYQYTWRPHIPEGDFLLEDYSGNIIAMFRSIFPGKKYSIGEVHGELILIPDAGRSMVPYPPFMDMVCLTAGLNRVLNDREAQV